jgi:hypothetical protein
MLRDVISSEHLNTRQLSYLSIIYGAVMAKEAGDNEKGRGAHEPWTNKERHIIVQHVLKHVLTNVGYGTIFNELIDVLDKQGLPKRTTQQVSIDQHPEHCPSGQSLTYKALSNNNVLHVYVISCRTSGVARSARSCSPSTDRRPRMALTLRPAASPRPAEAALANASAPLSEDPAPTP